MPAKYPQNTCTIPSKHHQRVQFAICMRFECILLKPGLLQPGFHVAGESCPASATALSDRFVYYYVNHIIYNIIAIITTINRIAIIIAINRIAIITTIDRIATITTTDMIYSITD